MDHMNLTHLINDKDSQDFTIFRTVSSHIHSKKLLKHSKAMEY